MARDFGPFSPMHFDRKCSLAWSTWGLWRTDDGAWWILLGLEEVREKVMPPHLLATASTLSI
jgi:hypothetical protein